jgi:hypothetical protein
MGSPEPTPQAVAPPEMRVLLVIPDRTPGRCDSGPLPGFCAADRLPPTWAVLPKKKTGLPMMT